MVLQLNRRTVLMGAAGALSAVAVGVGDVFRIAAAATGKAAIGKWGFDLDAMDRSIAPGDDFFRYAGGTWLKTAQIPPDRSSWGSFDILRAKSEVYMQARIACADT